MLLVWFVMLCIFTLGENVNLTAIISSSFVTLLTNHCFVFIYTYMYTYIYKHVYLYIHTYIQIYTYIHVYIYTYTHTDMCPDRTHCLMHLASPESSRKMNRTQNHPVNKYYLTYTCIPYMLYMYPSYVVYVCLIYPVCMPYILCACLIYPICMPYILCVFCYVTHRGGPKENTHTL